MNKQPVCIDTASFPNEIRPYLQNARVYDSSCRSNATVYYLDSGFYLKVDAVGALKREAALARTFFESGLGPEMLIYLPEERDYMLSRSAEGDDLTQHLDKPEMLCDVLAQALRMLHRQPIEALPISSHMQIFADFAANPREEGFNAELIPESFGVRSAQEALRIALENSSRLQADTLIHGDACLPNVIVKDSAFSAFIDLGMAGRGDKHIDLFWACWSLQYNLQNEKYMERFLDAYGREAFDYELLRTVAALDALT